MTTAELSQRLLSHPQALATRRWSRHEIYHFDPRRAEPQRLKTIRRYPVL